MGINAQQVAKVIWQRPHRIRGKIGTLESPRVSTLSRTSILSAVFAQLKPRDWLTDAGNNDRNNPHLTHSMRPINISVSAIGCVYGLLSGRQQVPCSPTIFGRAVKITHCVFWSTQPPILPRAEDVQVGDLRKGDSISELRRLLVTTSIDTGP